MESDDGDQELIRAGAYVAILVRVDLDHRPGVLAFRRVDVFLPGGGDGNAVEGIGQETPVVQMIEWRTSGREGAF